MNKSQDIGISAVNFPKRSLLGLVMAVAMLGVLSACAGSGEALLMDPGVQNTGIGSPHIGGGTVNSGVQDPEIGGGSLTNAAAPERPTQALPVIPIDPRILSVHIEDPNRPCEEGEDPEFDGCRILFKKFPRFEVYQPEDDNHPLQFNQ